MITLHKLIMYDAMNRFRLLIEFFLCVYELFYGI